MQSPSPLSSQCHTSPKSSVIQSECVSKSSHKISICQQQIISENYNQQQFADDDLYNEQSSLPLCMKEYYINEKQLNRLAEKDQGISHNDEKKLSKESGIEQESNQDEEQIKNNNQGLPVLGREIVEYYQSAVEERNQILSLELENEKIKNLHFQKMLSILIDEDSIQRQKLAQMSQFYRQKYQQFTQIEQENQRLKLKNQELQKQVQHYKGLIYIANHNYQLMQNKLEQTKFQVVSLQVQKQQRQKGFHEKLQNLKLVMKSLMTNLKTHENISSTERFQHNTRLQTKDHTSCQGLYSFGDQDVNLRQKREKNITQRQIVFNSVQNKIKPPNKPLISQRTQYSKQGTLRRKHQQKQNSQPIQRVEQTTDSNRNYASNNNNNNKSTTFTKLKSPKNMTVEQNYRRLFMKTLVSSSTHLPSKTN